MSKEFVKFLIAGVINTAVDWIIYYILAHVIKIPTTIAKTFGAIAGIICAYILNNLVFLGKIDGTFISHIKRFSAFFCAYSIGMFANISMFTIANKYTSIEIISLVLGTGISTIINYFLLKKIVFNK